MKAFMKMVNALVTSYCLFVLQVTPLWAEDSGVTTVDRAHQEFQNSVEAQRQAALAAQGTQGDQQQNDGLTDEERSRLSGTGNDGEVITIEEAQKKNCERDITLAADKTDTKKGISKLGIIMFATALSAYSLLTYCKGRPSAWLFVASGAIYLYSELAGFNKYQKEAEAAVNSYACASADDQAAALEAAAEQAELAAKAAEQKAKYTKTAAMGYMLAAAAAIVETISDMSSMKFADAGSCKNMSSIESPFQNNSPNSIDDIQRKIASTEKLENLIAFNIDASQSSYDALVNMQEYRQFLDGANKSINIDRYYEMKGLFADYDLSSADVSETKSFLKVALNGLSDMILPRAHAASLGGLAAYGIAGVATGMVINAATTAGGTFRTFATHGLVRAAGIMVIASIANSASSDISKVQGDLNARAAKFRGLADAVVLKGKGTNSISSATTGRTEIGTPSKIADGDGEEGKEGDGCMTGSSPSNFSYDGDCKCKKTNSCSTAKIPKTNYGQIDNSGILSESISQFGKGSNAAFSGNTEGFDKAQGELGKNAVRISRLNNKLKGAVNKIAQKAGSKPIDFNRLESAFRKKLDRDFERSLKKLNKANQERLLAGDPAFLKPLNKISNEKAEKVAYEKGSNIGNGKKAGTTVSVGGDNKKDWNLDFDFEEEDAAFTEAELARRRQAGGDELASNEDEISDNRNANLFNIIHKRYIKSAYPRFFNITNQ